MTKHTLTCAAFAALLACPLSLLAQDRYSIPADPNLKYSTPIAPGVAVPDKIESSIGTLNLTYGYPSADTVEKIYDNLDRSRALQAYLMAIPIVNQAGMRDSIRQFGPDNQTDVIWEDLVDPRTVELTANDNTIYNFVWVDTHKGPLVARSPARWSWGWSTISGIAGSPTSASPAKIMAKAASISSCRPITKARSRPAISSCGRAPTATGSSSAPLSWMARPSPAWSR